MMYQNLFNHALSILLFNHIKLLYFMVLLSLLQLRNLIDENIRSYSLGNVAVSFPVVQPASYGIYVHTNIARKLHGAKITQLRSCNLSCGYNVAINESHGQLYIQSRMHSQPGSETIVLQCLYGALPAIHLRLHVCMTTRDYNYIHHTCPGCTVYNLQLHFNLYHAYMHGPI